MTSEDKTNTSSQNTKFYNSEHVESTNFPSSQSTTFFHHRSTKWLIAILVIFVFLLVGSAFAFMNRSVHVNSVLDVLVSPTTFNPSPTTVADNKATWQTYRNEEYGFEFKYPPFWIDKTTKCLQSKCGLTDDISVFGEDFLGTTPGGPVPLTFTVSQSLGDRPITIDPESTIINKENIFIDGTSYPLTTYKRFEVEGSEEISDSIEIPKGDKTLYLKFSHITDGCLWSEISYPKEQCQKWNQDKLTEYRTLRNQILSTFRFLDNKVDTSNWKTYNNKDLGFSFRYPPNIKLYADPTLTEYFGLVNEQDNIIEVRTDIYDEILNCMENDLEKPCYFYNLGYDAEQFKKDIEDLRSGKYGNGIGCGYKDSEKVLNLGKVNAKSFVVLGCLDSCDVSFGRIMVFYPDDSHRVTISVYGPKDLIIKNDSSYFHISKNSGWKNCVNPEKGYGADTFYNDLIKGNTSQVSQEWYESFDQILSTFRFVENSTALDTKELCVQAGGVWQNWGLFPGEYCQIPAQDGGKACTDGSECELHSCITYKNSQNGQCRTYKDTFGCYSELTDGKMSTTLCVD